LGADTIDGRFVIEAEAASGGMGTVYRGRDLTTGATVAVKLLRRGGVEDAQRFAREASILAELHHDAIVQYVAHGITLGTVPYLVMEWVDGETLDARLRGPGISIAESVQVARRVADALAVAHARGIVHRDIKPANLMFPGGDLARATVLDFGIARPVSTVQSLTETGSVIGTPSYMSPEQVRGDRDVGPAADVFAIGCVLYECLTGRLAFEGTRFLALTAKILLWDPPRPNELAPDVPRDLDVLVVDMLAKDPARRPRDAAQLSARLAALHPVGDGAAVPRPRARAGPTSIERPSMRRMSIVVGAAPESTDVQSAPTMASDGLGVRRDLTGSPSLEGGHLEVLQDGALVVTFDTNLSPREQAHRAARAALNLREAMPDLLIGVATSEAHGDLASLVEEAVASLASEAIAFAFAGLAGPTSPPPGGIRVDDRTAALLEPDFQIVRRKKGIYLPRGGKL
jgi:serine/threonine protein kinase